MISEKMLDPSSPNLLWRRQFRPIFSPEDTEQMRVVHQDGERNFKLEVVRPRFLKIDEVNVTVNQDKKVPVRIRESISPGTET
jgi:hypothetical protein